MKKIILFFILVCLFAYGQEYTPQNPLRGPFEVFEVTDGDTIKLEKLGKVRLIGVDTPEKNEGDKLDRVARESGQSREAIQAMGRAASQFTQDLLLGEEVWVELDAREYDPYRRLLAYIYLPTDDGQWSYEQNNYIQVNLEIIRSGWADPLTIPPNVAYVEFYEEASKEARQESLGMWADVEQTVLIECIVYNPKGPDEGEEFVTLVSSEDVDVTDWRIVDRQGSIIFLEEILEEGFFYDFYVAEDESIWGNNGDSASLYNSSGQLVDEFSYEGGGIEACR